MQAKMNKPMDTKEIISHLDDVDYPVTGKAFMEACDNMSHASEEERMWVKNNIDMNRTYGSAEEIKRELKL